jgi:SNF2 family DNA or RNA helicase
MAHQVKALKASDGREFFAYHMDPGTGKTRVTLKDAWRSFERGEIDAVLVLAPNNVKPQWVKWDHLKEDDNDIDEVSKHLADKLPRILKGMWTSSATGDNKKCWAAFEEAINRRHHKLIILSTNYEALLVGDFFEFLKEFCKQYRVMIVADESTRIGKPGSRRTKRAIALADLCKMRREDTGTPVVKSPLKIYSQARFLDKNALPFRTYFGFRNTFCNMGGFQGREVLSYKNLDKLADMVAKFSFRARKEDCLDLPPQVFLKRRVYMTKEQTQAYKEMREEFFTMVQNEGVTAPIVLTQIMRLQQIAGGYVKTPDGKDIAIMEPKYNPKLQEALHLCEDAPGQVVVWARFRPELEGLSSLLPAGSFYEFHGGVPQADRGAIKAGFLRGDRPYLLGTRETGGIGLNQFVGADTVVSISSDFDTEKRIQGDDRNHRIGSERHKKITYYDIVVPNTVDMKILRVLRDDTQISAKVLKETWREWV